MLKDKVLGLDEYIDNGLLPKLNSFEHMMALYVVACMKQAKA